MGEKRYMISDAAKMVDVESHVLRYWEDELMVAIPRNEMGHRYYTDFHIDLMRKVKDLKERGFQLKAIRMLIPELYENVDAQVDTLSVMKEELENIQETAAVLEAESISETTSMERTTPVPGATPVSGAVSVSGAASVPETVYVSGNVPAQSAGTEVKQNVMSSKMEQFEAIIGNIVTKALRANNSELGKEVSDTVSDNVIKEIDYMMRLQNEREEERFKKFDEVLRSYQNGRKQLAATREKRRILGIRKKRN